MLGITHGIPDTHSLPEQSGIGCSIANITIRKTIMLSGSRDQQYSVFCGCKNVARYNTVPQYSQDKQCVIIS